MAALKEWRASAGYEAFLTLVEAEAVVELGALMRVDDADTTNFRRGKVAALASILTLADRIIPTMEAFYEREQQRRNDTSQRVIDHSAFWGSSHFFN